MYISVIQYKSHNEEETQLFSIRLGQSLNEPCCIALNGSIGAGKTCFVQGLAMGLGIEEVLSPTFSILHEHDGRINMLHADLYRLEEIDLYNLGLEEIFEDFDGVVVIEWASKFPKLLPFDFLCVDFEIEQETRRLMLRSNGPRSQKLLQKFQVVQHD